MQNENSLKDLISNSLQDVRKLLDANTVTGNPICLPNGVTIIPISRISMGFASGGLDLPSKGGDKVKDFGGGGGTGITVTPVGFLNVSPEGNVELISLDPTEPDPFEQVVDILNNAPQIVQKVKNVINGVPDESALKTERTVRRLENQIRSDTEKKSKKHKKHKKNK